MGTNCLRAGLLALSLVAALYAKPSAASCGGAFFENGPQSSEVQITGHRMALAVTRTQTIVWAEFDFSGAPESFAYVIPVTQGAKVELAHPDFLSSLDAVTRPRIVTTKLPDRRYPSSTGATLQGGSRGNGGSGGCGASNPGLASARQEAATEDDGSYGAGASEGTPSVTIESRQAVGPYDVTVLSAVDGDGLTRWLEEHRFAVPAEMKPIFGDYVRSGFQFLALRFRPDGSHTMRPLRVVSPGADALLPMRMARANMTPGAAVTLFAIGEGRYRVQGFAEASIDARSLSAYAWGIENYPSLAKAAAMQPRTWVVESSTPDLPLCTEAKSTGPGAAAAPVADAAADAAPACPWCALLGIDAAALDAGGAGDRAGVMVPETSECDSVGLRAALPTVRVTRLRGAMSEDLVRGDLRLEANPDQSTVSRTFVVEQKPDGSVAISRASISPAQPSSLGVAGLLVALGAVLLRRLRQPQRPAK